MRGISAHLFSDYLIAIGLAIHFCKPTVFDSCKDGILAGPYNFQAVQVYWFAPPRYANDFIHFYNLLTIDPIKGDFSLNVSAMDFLEFHGLLLRTKIRWKVLRVDNSVSHAFSSYNKPGPIDYLLTFPFQFGIALYPPLTQIMSLHMADFSRRYIQFCYLLRGVRCGLSSYLPIS